MSRSILMLMSIALTAVPSVTLAAEALQSHGGIHVGVPAAGVSVEGGAAVEADASASAQAHAHTEAQAEPEQAQAEPAEKKESRGFLSRLFGD